MEKPFFASLTDPVFDGPPDMLRRVQKLVEPIALEVPADLPSCGMQFGTIQLHPDGSLVAMGPDHPITGGYLQPFTVVWDDRWKLGQLAPGAMIEPFARLVEPA